MKSVYKNKTEYEVIAEKNSEAAAQKTARGGLRENSLSESHNGDFHSCVMSESDTAQTESVFETPLFRIYFMQTVSAAEEVFPELRRLEVAEAKNEKTRSEKYSVWKLLEYALQHTFKMSVQEVSFRKDACGKWTCDKCFFSLAHSSGLSCVALSSAPVGVDLENVSVFRKKIGVKLDSFFKKCLCNGENANRRDVESAVSLWTRKESVFKMRGGRFVPSEIGEEKTSVTVFRQILGERWCVSFCGKYSFAAEFFCVDADGGIV